MRYSKSLDHALLATYFANKAAKAKSVTARRVFQKKALASILEAGKQSDAAYGMKVLEASLRLAAENEGIVDPDCCDDDALPVEAAEEDVDETEDVDVEIDEDEEPDDDDESDDEEIDAAFNRVLARSRARKRLAARNLSMSRSRRSLRH